MMDCSFGQVVADDFEALLALRSRVMRPSLERLGRFDPDRSRMRFQSEFRPGLMRTILVDGTPVGCLTVESTDDYLEIRNFYIDLEFQGRGIGGWVLNKILEESDAKRVPCRITVLRGSDANRFYMRHGFSLEAEEEFDNFYVRACPAAGTQR